MQKSTMTQRSRGGSRLRLGVLPAIWFLLAVQTIAGAATYYVSPTGSNGNSGTDSSHPWATIAYAEQTAANGSTVYLMSGQYGNVLIDRANNGGRSKWDDAITFTPYPGATSNISQLGIKGDVDRFLIFDSVTFDYPDTEGQVGTTDVVRILHGGFLKFVGCTIHGKLGKDGNGEYADTYSTQHCVYLGSYYDPPVHDITFEGCDIGYTGQFGLTVNGPVSGPILIKDCEVHHFGASGLRHDGANIAKTTYQGNRVHTQVHVWTADHSTKHHGSGLHISGDNCDFIGNRVWCAGTSAPVRAYQGAIGGGFDGGVEVYGSYDDPSRAFAAGEYVSQGNAHGRLLRNEGAPARMIEIARATDATSFNAVDPIVSDEDPSKVWKPTSIGHVRVWGGRRKVTIKNNLVYQGANTYYKMELHDLGPGCEITNNTVIGSHVSATGWNYFWYALLNAPPLYYEGDIATLKFCNNLFVGHVDRFTPGATVVGNICFGYQNGKTQSQLDALFPGNKVYNTSPSVNTYVPLFTTSGAFFVGSDDFESYGFSQPADGPMGIEVAGSPGDLGDCFALAEGSDAVGFGNATYGATTDILGQVRDTPPDVGCYEIQSGEPGNHAPVLQAIGGKTTAIGETVTFQVTATDADNDTLTYSASGLPSGATFVDRVFTWTPTETQGGYHQVTFVASDGQAQDSETIMITVTGGNLPPILAAIGSKSVREGERLALAISATDADGDTITYSASGLPTGASLSGRDFSWTPGYDQAGNYQVTFIASDGQAQDSETVTITVVNVNRPPTLTAIPDRDVDQDSLLAFDLAATDPDGDTLTYSANGLPAGASFSGGSFTWTPTASQIGIYDITFIVSDGQLHDTVVASFTVVSTAPDNTAPTVAMASPGRDSIQVALNHLIKLHVTDAGQGVDPETVIIRVDDQVVYQSDTDRHDSILGRCSRTGNRYDYRYVFQANELFRPDRITTVQVSASDRAGNAMPTYTYAFLTEMRAFGNNFALSSTMAGPASQPAAATDPTGGVWAVWQVGVPGDRNVCAAYLAPGAEVFTAPAVLTTGVADRSNPDLGIAADGRPYVVWQEYSDGNWNIMVSTSSNGIDWSRPTAVTNSDGNETNPVVALDGRSPQRVYVAWQDDRNGNADIYVASSTNVFSDSTLARVTANTADQSDPDIAVDDNDNVILVWTDARNGHADIYGASSGQNWANVPVVAKPGNQNEPAVAIAPGSMTLHIAWTDDTPGNADIYYASSDGLPANPLSGASIIDDTAGADQTTPTITCIDSQGIFVCWQDFRHAGAGGDSDLFMADLGSGSVRTNVFVGDSGTNSDQSEPAAAIDAYGNPYFLWTDARNTETGVYYAASTFIDPVPLDSKEILATGGGTIGTDPTAIDSKDDVSIVVPAGACQFDARVTIAEILNPVITPVACLGSYDFGPSGIDFDAPVTVTIPYVFAAAGGSAKPYWYDSLTGAMSQQGITDVENLVISPTLNALRFRTTHFTPFYLVAGDAEVPVASAETPAGGCSIAPVAGGSPTDLILPYGILALVMGILRHRDRRRHRHVH